ncbi:aminoacyl-tRNA hydrolase [Ectothiorhodospira mobilis]|uniref:Aminoacyl-tRNA hydrolase n=1 Tax=Ectothiorhodospira mobilis TaxID=195064 RepID=A0A1I4QRH8_ECTMO|nr:aminoacyl-tRNA hydrolase [Ectothiorhodospira mobilis]SFM42310.1 aminoacyl-tRNA hydrolase [Ectothiorhodospira mobilis]
MDLKTRLHQALAWRRQLWHERTRVLRARLRRPQLWRTSFVGITGSVGKTTAKDLAVAVLQQRGPTRGNALGLNYLGDMAGMLLALPRDTRFAVLEVATSGPGTIDARVRLLRPRIAAMTVIGRDHIKRFGGSQEAIAEEKAKLIQALPADGVAVLNRDDPLIRALGGRTPVQKLWFGTAEDAHLRLLCARSDYPEPLILQLAYEGREYTCRTALHGTHLAVPVLTALGIGLAAGLSLGEAMAGLAGAHPAPGRMQVVPTPEGITFLRDDYKAPHWTLPPTLAFLQGARARRKVAVVGTLSDSSLSASKLYPKVARRMREVADRVVFVGPHALRALKARTHADDRQLVGFTDLLDAHHYLRAELREGDLVLLKGTNRMDHLVRLILARHQPITCWVQDCGRNTFCDRCPLRQRTDSRATPMDRVSGGMDPAGLEPDGEGAGGAPTSPAWLLVGLGNPGAEHDGTPHNLGADVLQRLADGTPVEWHPVPEGRIARTRIARREVILFRPGSAVNRSGAMVEALRRRLGVDGRRVMVIHDDMDLPLAEVRLKPSGSDGGHKGLRSLFAALGNDGFMPRIRVGARRPDQGDGDAREQVLRPFSTGDRAGVEAALERAAALVQRTLHEAPD